MKQGPQTMEEVEPSVSHRLDLTSPALCADPYPVYAAMRRSRPVCEVEPGGAWALFRHADIQLALRDSRLFSAGALRERQQPPWIERNPLADSMASMDPPQHTKLRALVNRAFHPRVPRMEQRIRAIAGELCDRLQALGEADFVAEFAARLPAGVIRDLLGLEVSDLATLKRWALNTSRIPHVAPESASVREVNSAVADMEGHFRDLIASRRRGREDDLTSDLVAAEVDGRTLTDDEIVSFLCLLLAAGIETVSGTLANAVHLLLSRPDDLALLEAEPRWIPRFVEEVLRFEPPIHNVIRRTTADVEVSSTRIPAGAPVLFFLASANRDEGQFLRPDCFDMRRDEQGSLSFGHSAHFCIGAMLARMEARVALEVVLSRFAALERLPGDVDWAPSLFGRYLASLPVRLTPR